MAKKAMVAMSGGVDSSVAALLMTGQGYDTIGVTMKLFHNEDIGVASDKTCCSLEDVEAARSVAFRLGIPFYVFNFSDTFKEQVIGRFVDAYIAGATPNPCIDCNRYIKFERLMRRAAEIECDYVVTGHYAVVERDASSGRFLLKKGLDAHKDQSYVLYSLTQAQLSKTLFPLGTMTKDKVRQIALDNGFVNAKKRESQDICFVPDGDYSRFIEEYTNTAFPEGDFTDDAGRVLGRHKGIIRYTVGQRKGLGLALDRPLYVREKDVEHNRVVLADEPALFSKTLTARDANWIACESLSGPTRVKAKIRYRQAEQWATAEPLDGGRFRLTFDTPQRAVTKGQAAVLYDGDVVVGGGTIE